MTAPRQLHSVQPRPTSSHMKRLPLAQSRRRPGKPRVDGGTREGRRRAAVILDVLAGVCTPVEAARMLDLSPARYYSLETKLLEALVEACEPHGHGPRRPPEAQLEQLRLQVERLQKECARKQALVRAVQRTFGLALPEPGPKAQKSRRRKPTVRALRAAAVLREEPGNEQESALASAQAAPASSQG